MGGNAIFHVSGWITRLSAQGIRKMPSSMDMLRPGDPIFHPMHGFGTVHGLTRRDPAYPIREVVAGEATSGQEEDYYDIELQGNGTLLVPVSRAESVGLRLLTNGLAAITACLFAPAQSLPEDPRERAAVLRARGRSLEPTALAGSVRDMLAQSRGRNLWPTEKTWLDNSCERLSTEAALVDGIARPEAREAIRNAVDQLGSR
jgi:RNA polymerase-interacting CarD/CdnL/TRCF family regulator